MADAPNVVTPLIACSSWAARSDIPSKCADLVSEQGAAADQALADASDILFELSGQRFPGLCEKTVRPNGQSIFDSSTRATSVNVLVANGWSDRSWSGWCGCNHRIGEYGCSNLSEVSLGGWPIVEVTAVKLDGDVLDPSEYRVDDSTYLVRLSDTEGPRRGWPCCQSMHLDSTEEGTFEVTFTYGSDGGGKRACAALACELLRAGSDDCKLPPNVQALNRQGVSMNIQSVVSLLDRGQTGVAEADRWLKAVNPTGQKRPGGILIPGTRSSVRRVGT